jgi:hypothetical protein
MHKNLFFLNTDEIQENKASINMGVVGRHFAGGFSAECIKAIGSLAE